MHKPIFSKTSTECIFHTLYDNSVTGKKKQWDIKVTNQESSSIITCYYGYQNGKKIETNQTIKSGKNIGKSNETTHYEQAILQATSKWNRKYDQGYKPNHKYDEGYKPNHKYDEGYKPNLQNDDNNNDDLINKTTNLNITNDHIVTFPMLAQDYNKHKNKVVYPAFCQQKLDGMRMIYNTTTKQITTRQGKEYSIIKESGKLYQELNLLPKGLILDGELYTDKVNFETLGVLRKTKNLTKQELDNLQKIEYHIYDIIDTTLTFEKRHDKIKELLYPNKYEKLIYVPTFLIENEQEIKNYHLKFLEQGFEGTMIRNKHSLYKKKCRSSDLLKYKDFQDSEFEIVDYTLEKDTSGADENLIVWVVAVPVFINWAPTYRSIYPNVDKSFVKCKVRPQGTKEERKELYKKCVDNFDQFKGRKLWVKYFEKTNDGNLRFPTTKCNCYTEYIRDEIL
jgi:DNA ligase-1